MSFAKFRLCQKSAPIKPKIKKKALLILLDHQNLIDNVKAQKERYSREGYEVQTLFINLASLLKKKNKGETSTLFIQELQDKIAWLKISNKTLLAVCHHGPKPNTKSIQEIPEHLKGAATAVLLSNHGLNDNLGKMNIKYNPCYGGRPDPSQDDTAQADDFYNVLHDYGAGDFYGNASTEITIVLIENPKKVSPEALTNYLTPYENIINEVENAYDTTMSPPLLKSTKDPIPESLLETYEQAKKNVLFVEQNKERYQAPLQRGDSLVEIQIPEYPDLECVYKLPETKNSKTSNYNYKVYYLARQKTQTSQVEKTPQPRFQKGVPSVDAYYL